MAARLLEDTGRLRLLVLSFYYAPDLSAGSFRASALVRALENVLPSGSEIDVVTTRPNRYSTFEVDVPSAERTGDVTVHRLPVPTHRSGLLDQSRAFVAFAMAALRVVRGRRYDLVVATSSRLMTAALGSAVARSKGSPLYLDIRDIFLENIRQVIPAAAYALLRPVLVLIERFAFGAAAKVNVVSEGFVPYIERRYPSLEYSCHPNGVDEEFIGFAEAHPRRSPGTGAIATVVYAGNIGEGQGLHEIIPLLAQRMRGRIHLRVIGDGGRRAELLARLSSMNVDNVELLAPMSRRQLLDEYARADVLFLHLNSYEAFETLLPSKVFEYAATGRPIWAGVAGYAASFLRKHIDNSVVFTPCDVVEAERTFEHLRLESHPRTRFTTQFSRSAITARMADEIAEVATKGG